ncbi:hypothetical protein CLU79DRAFT_748456 [Phycomyces nitens]|nr:hypothetical protein CLU79DRAFT_748456 [Phycomyces nitens]
MTDTLDTNTWKLDRICIDNVCHCDWRITITNCEEERQLRIINIVCIALSAVASIIALILILHRTLVRGHRIFDIDIRKGCFRPKPIDSMLVMLFVLNLLRMVYCIILATDVSKSLIFRSFMFDFPLQWGYAGAALYLTGILQTLADSHKTISSGWLPSPRMADIVSAILLFLPFTLNNIFSITSGALAYNNPRGSEIMTRLLYSVWFFHCIFLCAAVTFAGTRLTRILTEHLENFSSYGERYNAVRTGILKIHSVMVLLALYMLFLAVAVVVYGFFRNTVLLSLPATLIMASAWNLVSPLATFFIEVSMVIKPSMIEKGSSVQKSNDGTNDVYDLQNNPPPFTNSPMHRSNIQGTLSHNAFDGLKSNQIFLPQSYYQTDSDVFSMERRDVAAIRVADSGIPIADSQPTNIQWPSTALLNQKKRVSQIHLI